jgi:16S rRNA processing protein RimM
MKVDNCYQLGDVLKTHGLKGEVIIFLDSDFPDKYNELESMFLLQAGKLVPFFIESCQVQGNTARLKIEDIEDQDTAKTIVGLPVYLPLSLLDESEGYYYHELIGYDVTCDSKILGKVTEIYDQERNPLFAFEHEGFEVLVPFQDQFMKSVDKATKIIVLDLPDGYLDIYMEAK